MAQIIEDLLRQETYCSSAYPQHVRALRMAGGRRRSSDPALRDELTRLNQEGGGEPRISASPGPWAAQRIDSQYTHPSGPWRHTRHRPEISNKGSEGLTS
jgi:hypothetical protein